MIRLGNRDPLSDDRLILTEMLADYRMSDPKTLYRPLDRHGRINSNKTAVLLRLSDYGLVHLYYLDGVPLGAELTHEGIRRAERLNNAR